MRKKWHASFCPLFEVNVLKSNGKERNDFNETDSIGNFKSKGVVGHSRMYED
ncbi:hypothetical protein ABQD91_04690 [Enterococcus hirae]